MFIFNYVDFSVLLGSLLLETSDGFFTEDIGFDSEGFLIGIILESFIE